MTRKLRYRIMAIIMLLSSATLISILIAINLLQNDKTRKEERGISQFYLEHRTRENFPPEPPLSGDKELRGNRNHLSDDELEQMSKLYPLVYARYTENMELISMDTSQGNNYDKETLQNYCEEVLQKEADHGIIGDFSYIKRHFQNVYDIVLMDRQLSGRSNRNFLLYSIILGLIGLIIFFFLSYVISGLIVKPVEKAFLAQKEFVAAASHELKTPLTVIQANSELLEDEYGDNKWLSYIQTECSRMSKLISSLLLLTKLEQLPDSLSSQTEFNLSDACLARILPFESVAFEKHLTLEYSIAPDIIMNGESEELQQVLTILLDNALYYTKENGRIDISLSEKKHNILLSVANEGVPVPPEEREKLFLRFYRIDKARSRENGHFGLGLSIAKSIVDQYHGSIDIQCENGVTCFTVKLPGITG